MENKNLETSPEAINMEQQNKQPIQEKINGIEEPRHSLKKPSTIHKWLYLAAGIIMFLILFGAYVLIQSGSQKRSVLMNFDECVRAGYPVMESYPRQCQIPDGQVFLEEIDRVGKDRCIVTGCSGQICSDEEVITTCEALPEYACYKNAACERQSNGECGWTQTSELVQCLKERRGKQTVVDTLSWQTYRNEELGFEVKYPEEWIVEKSGPNYVQQQIERGEVVSGTVAPTLETISFFSPAWQAHPRLQFTITISETSKEISIESYDNLSYSSSCDPRWLQKRPEDIQVITNEHGIEFLEVKVIDPIRATEPEMHFSCYYSKSLNGNKMAFEMAFWEDSLDFEYAEKQIEAILSRFRFIE